MLAKFRTESLNKQHEFLMQAIDDLTLEELRWQATPEANTIEWLLWHMFRVEDTWIQFFIRNQTEIWEHQEWTDVFGLPARDNGFGHTPEQVSNFPNLELAKLLAYGAEVRQGTLTYLSDLDSNKFNLVPRERRPNITVADVFRQVVGEFYQHTGQIAYIKGMMRGADAFPPNYTAPS